jgi:hypothetical protein
MALDISSVIKGRLDGKTNFAQRTFPVANGVTVTVGDFVYFSSGRLTSATVAGARLLGMALETAAGNSAGTVKAQVCIDPLVIYLLKNDNDTTTFAASHVGTNFDLIGATGAQLVDTSTTGTSGSLLCIEYNPQIDPVKSDLTYGLFIIAESPLYVGTGGQ